MIKRKLSHEVFPLRETSCLYGYAEILKILVFSYLWKFIRLIYISYHLQVIDNLLNKNDVPQRQICNFQPDSAIQSQ